MLCGDPIHAHYMLCKHWTFSAGYRWSRLNDINTWNCQVMHSTPAPAEKRKRPWVRRTVSLCAAIAVCSALATWRSYARSDSLTFMDATVCLDEGLLSLQIPLVRVAPRQEPATMWVSYKRGKMAWEAPGGGGKAKLRNWMSMLGMVRCEGRMAAGFGYWKGAWQSNSRPGPFIVMFTPVWFAFAVACTLVAMFFWLRMRFTLAAMLMGMTFVGGLLWLLSLRASE